MPIFTTETTVDVTVDFSVYCGRCGAGICGNCNTNDRKMTMTVEPCEQCLKDERKEGYDEGYDKGYADGEEK